MLILGHLQWCHIRNCLPQKSYLKCWFSLGLTCVERLKILKHLLLEFFRRKHSPLSKVSFRVHMWWTSFRRMILVSSQHKTSLILVPSILFSCLGFCRSSWHFTCNLPPRRVRVPHVCQGLTALPPALVSTSSTTATGQEVWRLRFSVPLVSSSPGKGLVASQVRCMKSKWLA